jgi:hypothetical protein
MLSNLCTDSAPGKAVDEEWRAGRSERVGTESARSPTDPTALTADRPGSQPDRCRFVEQAGPPRPARDSDPRRGAEATAWQRRPHAFRLRPTDEPGARAGQGLIESAPMSTRRRAAGGSGTARWYWCALPVLLGILGVHGLAAGHGTTGHGTTGHGTTGAAATTIASQTATRPHQPTAQLTAASSGSASSGSASSGSASRATQHPPAQHPPAHPEAQHPEGEHPAAQHPPVQHDTASLGAAGWHTTGGGHHGKVPEACLGLCMALLISLARRLAVRRTPRLVAVLRAAVGTLQQPLSSALPCGSAMPRFTVMRC